MSEFQIGGQGSSGGPLEITGELSIDTAQELRDQLLEVTSQGRVTEVDLSKVHKCDAAGLQLVYCMSRLPRRFRLAAISSPIEEIAVALGLHLELAPEDTNRGL